MEQPPGYETVGCVSDVPLTRLLGGRGGALDASVPPLAFAAGWLVAGWAGAEGTAAVHWAGAAALLSALVIAGWRLRRGDRPRAVLIGLLGVAVAVLIVLRTGRAVDFFLIQIVSNAVSALAWMVSIAIRWPLLGVVVGIVLGQRARWRRDPHLVSGYSRASWIWVAQYLIRLAVFIPLYVADKVVALGVARAALTWPLVAGCVALSWPAIRSALPADHPGLRHPDDATSR
jgi:Protein of unknown function (DUF3159)